MLSYEDVSYISIGTRGINDDSICFLNVTTEPSVIVRKSLYVSINAENREECLKKALYNGAVAAVWQKNIELPRFLPNHFPVFLVDDTLLAFAQLIELYVKKIEENRYDIMTNFFYEKHEKQNTYDPLVENELKKLTTIQAKIKEGRG
jgi:UDP-N-acetylmuramyl pentapeptide synthase